MGDVVKLRTPTTADLPADKILRDAIGKLDGAIVIGIDKDGGHYIRSSMGNVADIRFLLECTKMMVDASVVAVPD